MVRAGQGHLGGRDFALRGDRQLSITVLPDGLPFAAPEAPEHQPGHKDRVEAHRQPGANQAQVQYFNEQKAQAHPQQDAGKHADVEREASISGPAQRPDKNKGGSNYRVK